MTDAEYKKRLEAAKKALDTGGPEMLEVVEWMQDNSTHFYTESLHRIVHPLGIIKLVKADTASAIVDKIICDLRLLIVTMAR